MAWKLVWRFVDTVSKEGPDVYRMVSSEVEQRITCSKSVITVVYREESPPNN